MRVGCGWLNAYVVCWSHLSASGFRPIGAGHECLDLGCWENKVMSCDLVQLILNVLALEVPSLRMNGFERVLVLEH